MRPLRVLPLLFAVAGVLLAAFPGSARAQLLGPTPYLGFGDSPFNGQSFAFFHLADMEGGTVDTPGVSASAGAPFAPGSITDSVDEDDGSIDGSGTGGWSYFSGSGPTGVTFTFDEAVLGRLPTHVGVVWTDGVNDIRFEAFDINGVSLGGLDAASADGNFSGGTAEDRFFGIVHLAGVKSIRLQSGLPANGGGIELDHLQYGAAGEAPATSACCLPDGSCEELTAEQCAARSGSFSEGATCDVVDCEPPDDDIEPACWRGPGFWKQQCAQKGNGSTKFDPEQMAALAACVNARVDGFDWEGGAEFDGFCEAIDPAKPMNPHKQALRHFATLLANVCAGELELVAGNGSLVRLDERAEVDCGHFEVETVGELIDAIDNLLGELAAEGDSRQQGYGRILACLEDLEDHLELAGDCSSVDDELDRAQSVALGTARPNPFRGGTELQYRVNAADGARVEITVHDVAGRLVRRLDHGFRHSGVYPVFWDGADDGGTRVGKGIYFVRARNLDDGGVSATRVVHLR